MFEEEPEVLNEDDPAVKLELFETMKFMGTTPNDLADPKEAKEYEEWLKKDV
jgi:hypothetical protein